MNISKINMSLPLKLDDIVKPIITPSLWGLYGFIGGILCLYFNGYWLKIYICLLGVYGIGLCNSIEIHIENEIQIIKNYNKMGRVISIFKTNLSKYWIHDKKYIEHRIINYEEGLQELQKLNDNEADLNEMNNNKMNEIIDVDLNEMIDNEMNDNEMNEVDLNEMNNNEMIDNEMNEDDLNEMNDNEMIDNEIMDLNDTSKKIIKKKEVKPRKKRISATMKRILWHTSKKIIKNKEVKPRKKSIPLTLKRLVWNKYIGQKFGEAKCLCCKTTDITQLSFHCGHVVAESCGGELIVTNLRPICQSCNSSMRTKNMNDFMESFK